jgi:hypothetical protein
VGELQLRAESSREKEYLTEITVYATALAMNYVTRGKFVPEGRKKVTGDRLQGTKKRKVTGDRVEGAGEKKKEKENGVLNMKAGTSDLD